MIVGAKKNLGNVRQFADAMQLMAHAKFQPNWTIGSKVFHWVELQETIGAQGSEIRGGGLPEAVLGCSKTP